jgi:hypothetical protein
LVEAWDEPKMRAYRLVMEPDRLYQHIAPPPSP